MKFTTTEFICFLIVALGLTYVSCGFGGFEIPASHSVSMGRRG